MASLSTWLTRQLSWAVCLRLASQNRRASFLKRQVNLCRKLTVGFTGLHVQLDQFKLVGCDLGAELQSLTGFQLEPQLLDVFEDHKLASI